MEEENHLINFKKQMEINSDIFEVLFTKHNLNCPEAKFALEQCLIPIDLLNNNKLDHAMLEGLKKIRGVD